MEHITFKDLNAAAAELPEHASERAKYIAEHLKRLGKKKKVRRAMIANFAGGALRYHAELSKLTPEQFAEYITAMLLIVFRTEEIGKTREDALRAGEHLSDPGDITRNLLHKLRNAK